MSLNDLANLGQVIGAIAVVISLIYVALQIRQNTNAVRSATAQTVHEHFANRYQLIAARRRAFPNRRERIARLRIAFGAGKSSIHRDFYVVPVLFAERVFEMARRIA